MEFLESYATEKSKSMTLSGKFFDSQISWALNLNGGNNTKRCFLVRYMNGFYHVSIFLYEINLYHLPFVYKIISYTK